VDDSYFDEEMPFNDPRELEYKFEALETQSLFYINRLQDMETQLEEMRYMETKRRTQRDKEFHRQLVYKQSIDEDIEK
jgi:hypothetical protein